MDKVGTTIQILYCVASFCSCSVCLDHGFSLRINCTSLPPTYQSLSLSFLTDASTFSTTANSAAISISEHFLIGASKASPIKGGAAEACHSCRNYRMGCFNLDKAIWAQRWPCLCCFSRRWYSFPRRSK